MTAEDQQALPAASGITPSNVSESPSTAPVGIAPADVTSQRPAAPNPDDPAIKPDLAVNDRDRKHHSGQQK